MRTFTIVTVGAVAADAFLMKRRSADECTTQLENFIEGKKADEETCKGAMKCKPESDSGNKKMFKSCEDVATLMKAEEKCKDKNYDDAIKEGKGQTAKEKIDKLKKECEELAAEAAAECPEQCKTSMENKDWNEEKCKSLLGASASDDADTPLKVEDDAELEGCKELDEKVKAKCDNLADTTKAAVKACKDVKTASKPDKDAGDKDAGDKDAGDKDAGDKDAGEEASEKEKLEKCKKAIEGFASGFTKNEDHCSKAPMSCKKADAPADKKSFLQLQREDPKPETKDETPIFEKCDGTIKDAENVKQACEDGDLFGQVMKLDDKSDDETKPNGLDAKLKERIGTEFDMQCPGLTKANGETEGTSGSSFVQFA